MEDYVTGATTIVDDSGAAKLRYAPRTEAAVFRHLPDHLTSVLRRLKVPLTVIAGEDSDLLTPERRRTLSRLGIRLRCVPGGHMFPFEHPQATHQPPVAGMGGKWYEPQCLALPSAIFATACPWDPPDR